MYQLRLGDDTTGDSWQHSVAANKACIVGPDSAAYRLSRHTTAGARVDGGMATELHEQTHGRNVRLNTGEDRPVLNDLRVACCVAHRQHARPATMWTCTRPLHVHLEVAPWWQSSDSQQNRRFARVEVRTGCGGKSGQYSQHSVAWHSASDQ